MNFHEYQAKELFAQYGIAVPAGQGSQRRPSRRRRRQARLAATQWVVKAQIHAGGRGKAGGVKFCRSAR